MNELDAKQYKSAKTHIFRNTFEAVHLTLYSYLVEVARTGGG